MTNAFVHQIHDKLFKSTLSDGRVAKDLFKAYLPKKLLSQMDLSTLELQNNSFIDQQFQKSEADVIYKTKLKKNDLFLYTLCEHQSTSVEDLPLRIWEYMMRLVSDYHEKFPNNPLPMVYPIVVYTGQRAYKYSMDFFDLFGEKKAEAKKYWQGPIPLIDVCREPDETIEKHRWFGLIELVFKHRDGKEFSQFAKKISPWLDELAVQGGVNVINDVLFYIVKQYQHVDYRYFTTQSNQHFSEKIRGETMTIAEQLIQEGIEIGRAEGKTIAEQLIQEGIEIGRAEGKTIAEQLIQEGIEIGRAEGKTIAEQLHQEGIEKGKTQARMAVLLLLLEQKFNQIPEHYYQRVAVANSETVQRWCKQLLGAHRLEDVFQ